MHFKNKNINGYPPWRVKLYRFINLVHAWRNILLMISRCTKKKQTDLRKKSQCINKYATLLIRLILI